MVQNTKQVVQFGVMSAMAIVAAGLIATSNWSRILFAWIAVAMLVVTIAYGLGRWPFVIKRDDGSQAFLAWLILWPHLLLTRFSFLVYRLLQPGAVATAEAVPGLWFSRRLLPRELPQSNLRWRAILDLASEFPRIDVPCEQYRSIPLLDAAVPSHAQLQAAVEWIDEQIQHGPVLVHCALGHGRTGSVVLAWMITRGHVPDVQAGIDLLRSHRASFGLSHAQAAAIESFVQQSRLC